MDDRHSLDRVRELLSTDADEQHETVGPVDARPAELYETTIKVDGFVGGNKVVLGGLSVGPLTDEACDEADGTTLLAIAAEHLKRDGSALAAAKLVLLTGLMVDEDGDTSVAVTQADDAINAEQLDAWDDAYGDTHEHDGTPY